MWNYGIFRSVLKFTKRKGLLERKVNFVVKIFFWRKCKTVYMSHPTKYLEQNEVIQQNWTGEGKFGICFYLFLTAIRKV